MRSALFAVISAALVAGCSSGGSSSPVAVSQTLAQGAASKPAPTSITAAMVRRGAQALSAAYKFDTIYQFGSQLGDGYRSQATLLDVNGTLYGTTLYGGTNFDGTVFSVTPTGTETVIYSFKGGADGQYPAGNLTYVNGTLYGTTQSGGASGNGTVFSVSPTGSELVLYSFKGGADGSSPQAGLINVNGTLYGTTEFGGTGNCGFGDSGCGTVFGVTTASAENVLHSFTSAGGDGYWPAANLTNVGGTLYGTTSYGGASRCGTVFSIPTSGAEQVLHSFDCSDGAYPSAGLINMNGTLYGTAPGGGNFGYGTVYSVTLTGTEKVIWSFIGRSIGGNDGAEPYGSLVGENGALYGTTYYGGNAHACSGGCGTVFSVTTTSTESILHNFTGGANGKYPVVGLTKLNGLLFGVTSQAGSTGSSGGTLFRLRP